MDTKQDCDLFGGTVKAPRSCETLPVSITHRVVKDSTRRKRLTESQIAEAQAMRSVNGMTYQAIANMLGVCYQAVYYALNPEKQKRRNLNAAADYRANKKEILLRLSIYNQAHKEEKRLYDAAYNQANKEERSSAHKVYYQNHKEEHRLYNAAYYNNHKPEYYARASARRSIIQNSTTGDLAQIAEIYRRAKEDPKVRCYLCKKLIPLGDRHVDHILPVALGGPTRPSNLAITCSYCNLSKGSKHPNELGLLI